MPQVDEMFGSDEELEELTDSEEEVDPHTEAQLRSMVLGETSSKKAHSAVQSESRPEDILNLPTDEGMEGGFVGLTVGVGDLQPALKGVHKSLEALEKQSALTAPLPKRIQDRQIRKAAYSHAVESLSKWDDLVYANRMAPTIEFASPGAGLERPRTLEDMVEKFEPESQMEREIAALLKSSGATDEESIVRMEDEHALKSMDLAELKKKRGQLAKMRSLLFQHEIKSRRIKKIKSKEYHRRLQRAIRKKAVRFSGLDSDEAAKKLLEEMAYSRMKERLTQKHSTMNRFARRIMRRGWGVADEQTKQALEEQLRQSQELKQKIKSAEPHSSDDSSSSSESDEEGQPEFRRTRKALLKVLEGDAEPESMPRKGLIGLPFMQKAMQRQRAETQAEATKMLQELDGVKETGEKRIGKSRMQFSGEQTQKESDSSDSDEEHAKRMAEKLKKLRAQNTTVPQQGNGELNSAHSFLFREGTSKSKSQSTIPATAVEGAAVHTQPVMEIDLTEDTTQNPDSPEQNRAADSAETGVGVEGVTTKGLSQEDLIKLAFADDDVQDEFQQEKEAETAQELPKVEEISLLPGWGRWKDDQQEPKWMQDQRSKNARTRQRALNKRKDAKKPFVFISEKPNEHLDKYRVTSMPRTFTSEEAYKASIRHPIGQDFNTATAFEDLIRPRVVKRKGVIIEPLKIGKNAKDIREHVKEVKQGNVKVRKIVNGEVRSQLRFDASLDATAN